LKAFPISKGYEILTLKETIYLRYLVKFQHDLTIELKIIGGKTNSEQNNT
jgi:hypothetical protein